MRVCVYEKVQQIGGICNKCKKKKERKTLSSKKN